MKQVHDKSTCIADALLAKPVDGGTLRISGVPNEIPLSEAIRNADRIAFCHADDVSAIIPASVTWEYLKGAGTAEKCPPASHPEHESGGATHSN